MDKQYSDQQLVKSTLLGDNSSFDSLVLKYQPRLSQVISRSLSDKSMADDLTQDVFVKAFRSLHTFKGESSFYTWIYRIAINTVKNFIKYNARHPCYYEVTEEKLTHLPTRHRIKDYASPEHWLRCDEMGKLLDMALAELPDELLESIILREIDGLSYNQIASVMHCPLGTVRSRIFRARHVVDAHLKGYGITH